MTPELADRARQLAGGLSAGVDRERVQVDGRSPEQAHLSLCVDFANAEVLLRRGPDLAFGDPAPPERAVHDAAFALLDAAGLAFALAVRVDARLRREHVGLAHARMERALEALAQDLPDEADPEWGEQLAVGAAGIVRLGAAVAHSAAVGGGQVEVDVAAALAQDALRGAVLPLLRLAALLQVDGPPLP